MLKFTSSRKGFTLLEILLVVGIISILAGIVILAINPTKQLGDTRNAQRRSDVLNILNAAYQYSLDHNGFLPASTTLQVATCDTGTNKTICQDSGACTNLVNLYADLVGASSTYLSSIPRDPSVVGSAGTTTGYAIVKTSATGGRLTVCAPLAENGVTITVTR
jgi:type IV pilus assembly protein PilA